MSGYWGYYEDVGEIPITCDDGDLARSRRFSLLPGFSLTAAVIAQHLLSGREIPVRFRSRAMTAISRDHGDFPCCL
jgi:hypothetical protein